MSLLKFVYRLRRIDDLIKRENTGASDEFAEKVGISRSMLMENLREMRELGAKIEYCQRRNSYRYLSDFELIIGHSAKQTLRGGKSIYWANASSYIMKFNCN
jgi:biotin operon repressor